MKRAVFYGRFSSGKQTEQSIDGQRRKCEEYAREHGITIVNEYVDRAKTGRNDNRPAFQMMLRDSYTHSFDYVLVYAVDRFARDDGDYGADKKLLQQNGVKILSATETIGTNSDGSENLGGILTEGLLVALAKYYSRELSQKIRRGQYENVQKKNTLGGSVLYGYETVEKKPVIVPDRAKIVHTMFEMYADGASAYDIADALNEKGIKNSKGGKFVANSIMHMLKNRSYIGEYVWGEYLIDDFYPPIVEKELFMTVQRKIDYNKRKPGSNKAKVNFSLSGKLYCGHCKNPMVGESGTSMTGRTYLYYKCSGKKRFHLDCPKKNLRKDEIENLIVNQTLLHVLHPSVLPNLIDEISAVFNDDKRNSEIAVLQDQLKQVNSQIKNLIDAIKNGIYSSSTQKELTRLEEDKLMLEEKIAKQDFLRTVSYSRDQLEYWFHQFADMDKTDETSRQDLLMYFVNKVIAYNDRIAIIYNHLGSNVEEISIEQIENLIEKEKNPNSEKFGFDEFGAPNCAKSELIVTRSFFVLIFQFIVKK